MNNSTMTIIVILPIIAMINLISNQTHFLMALLSLEGITLSLLLLIPHISATITASNMAASVILLTFGACEASLGLSLMVLMSRTYGNDMLSTLSFNKC